VLCVLASTAVLQEYTTAFVNGYLKRDLDECAAYGPVMGATPPAFPSVPGNSGAKTTTTNRIIANEMK
jgi:hypothetical protein